jgi:DNA invertase Pin-like site-specific DNA recombinase
MADVVAGKVDIIVVYKIDRLTRSLADFARIVEVLDRAEASFVSVTQSFNTTTSMGRLTLNVLLSFAQFEREVTGERIRDKVAASKAKGMWMGGVVLLGYQVRDRKLVVVEEEAASVRLIFDRYIELKSTGLLAEELQERGVLTKRRELKDGRVFGSQPFSRGALAHLLKNRVYVGDVTHRDQVYAGEHPPIIERDLWETAQAYLADNRHQRRTSSRAAEPSLLAGKIVDGLGRPMSPSHTSRGALRYRYYVSRSGEGDAHRPWRLPAHELERLVVSRLAQLISEGRALTERVGVLTGETLDLILQRSQELGRQLAGATPRAAGVILDKLGTLVSVHDDRIDVEADVRALLNMVLGSDAEWLKVEPVNLEPLRVSVPVQLKRRGQELRLVFQRGDVSAATKIDDKLVELLVKAHEARETLLKRPGEVSKEERPHLTRLARLSYLAPDIVTAILDGKQPPDLSARRLLRAAPLPSCWSAQRATLGFS